MDNVSPGKKSDVLKDICEKLDEFKHKDPLPPNKNSIALDLDNN